jgi:N-acetylmuramoyl-L-alanine amidase CwlA
MPRNLCGFMNCKLMYLRNNGDKKAWHVYVDQKCHIYLTIIQNFSFHSHSEMGISSYVCE